MNLNSKPVKEWFGFTRRERRSSFILFIIVIIIIASRYIVPERNSAIEDITMGISGIGSYAGLISSDISYAMQPFSFDPNSASYDTLIKLGFAEKEANTIIKYRSKGGKFRQPSDIKKIYGIDEKIAEKFIPFIEVKTDTIRNVKRVFSRQQKTLLDINNCDSASLDRLPGIGPVLSARIIKYRNLLGGYATVDQLKEVYGLPVETFDLIKGKIYADSSVILRIKINTAGYKELSRLPYFEKYEVSAILKFRELKGRITGIGDLTENKLITSEKALKIRHYLKFD